MPINCSANSFLLKGTVLHTAVPKFRGAMGNHSPLNHDLLSSFSYEKLLFLLYS